MRGDSDAHSTRKMDIKDPNLNCDIFITRVSILGTSGWIEGGQELTQSNQSNARSSSGRLRLDSEGMKMRLEGDGRKPLII